jgi:hypothetical protein
MPGAAPPGHRGLPKTGCLGRCKSPPVAGRFVLAERVKGCSTSPSRSTFPSISCACVRVSILFEARHLTDWVRCVLRQRLRGCGGRLCAIPAGTAGRPPTAVTRQALVRPLHACPSTARTDCVSYLHTPGCRLSLSGISIA